MFCIKCGTKLADDANFCNKCGTKVNKIEDTQEKGKRKHKNSNEQAIVVNASPEQEIVAEVNNNKVAKKDIPVEDMVTYLEKAKKLEVRKYSLQNALNNIRAKIQENKIQSVSSKLYGFSFKDAIVKAFEIAKYVAIIVACLAFAYQLLFVNDTNFWLKVIMGVTCLFIFTGGFWEAVIFGIKWGAIVGGSVFAIAFVICFVIFIVSMIRTKKAQKSQDDSVMQENLNKAERVKKLQKQEAGLMKELKETERVLGKVYGLDVIYKKYRDLVSVTTIQEYFESGRCSSLYGYTGAYNIYENEIRQNTIISRLEDILVSLDQIKQGQYALFLAIQEGNRMTQEILSNSYDTLSAAKESVAQNKIAAENSKMTAENTEILMYCEAFRKY